MSEIQIRLCRAEDFEAVVPLLCQLWPGKPLDTLALRVVFDKALASDAQIYLCVTEGSRVIGFGSLTFKNNLWHEGSVGNVDELVVDEKCRGKGVGAKLLASLIDLARERGCRRVELDSAHHRKEAHRFYERQGFENRACLFSRIL